MEPILDHVPRRLSTIVAERLREEPVVLLEGPRSVGKSTLLREIAAREGVTVIDLDDPSTRDAVRADLARFVGGRAPVMIDEYQLVDETLDAIKAELNVRLQPGRFVLAGSTRFDALPRTAQSLTGRLHRMQVLPLSQGEIVGARLEDLVTVLLRDPGSLVTGDLSDTTREDYVERVVAGGFPIPLSRGRGRPRERWFEDYLELLVRRDITIGDVRKAPELPHMLRALASQRAQVLNARRVAVAVGLGDATAATYIDHLESVFLVRRLPAWGRTLRSRVTAKPKVHVVDSGLAAHLLALTEEKLAARSAAALTEFGYLLETFCVGEVAKQLSWADETVHLGHWRANDREEVDIVLERRDGKVAGIEVKAGGRADAAAFAGLKVLRDKLGDDFLGGIVLYTGPRSFTYDRKLHAVPVDRLWA